jgi:hypothetical protein
MNQTILTEPIELPISKVICKVISFNVRLVDLILGTSVKIVVEVDCLTGKKKSSENKVFILEGDEYLAWGSDDNYITEFVKSKLLSVEDEEKSTQSVANVEHKEEEECEGGVCMI